MLGAKQASPARIAQTLYAIGFSHVAAKSIEHRLRRFENDPHVDAALGVHPFVRQPLALGQPARLLLLLDPTTQEERFVMLTAAVWYRGQALSLA